MLFWGYLCFTDMMTSPLLLGRSEPRGLQLITHRCRDSVARDHLLSASSLCGALAGLFWARRGTKTVASVPARFVWTNGLTLPSAIELAHGFTDFADRSLFQIKYPDGTRSLQPGGISKLDYH